MARARRPVSRARARRPQSSVALVKAERSAAGARSQAAIYKAEVRDVKRAHAKARRQELAMTGIRYAAVVAFLTLGIVLMGQVLRIKPSWGKRVAAVSFVAGIFLLFTSRSRAQAYAAVTFLGMAMSYVSDWAKMTDLIPGDFEDEYIEPSATAQDGR